MISRLTRRRRSRRRHRARRGNPALARGVVMVAITAGAGMWGYAMVEIATRAF